MTPMIPESVVFTSVDDTTVLPTSAGVMVVEWNVPNGSQRALSATSVLEQVGDEWLPRFLDLRADFANPVSSVSVEVGNELQSYEDGSVFITAYTTSGGSVAGTVTSLPSIGSSGSRWLLEVSAPNIAYVVFGGIDAEGLGNTLVADNFTYSVVPAPGALLLAAPGLACVRGLRRRRVL
jgi:hypothetical protein